MYIYYVGGHFRQTIISIHTMHNAKHAEVEQLVRGACGRAYLVWRSHKGIQIKVERGGKHVLPTAFIVHGTGRCLRSS